MKLFILTLPFIFAFFCESRTVRDTNGHLDAKNAKHGMDLLGTDRPRMPTEMLRKMIEQNEARFEKSHGDTHSQVVDRRVNDRKRDQTPLTQEQRMDRLLKGKEIKVNGQSAPLAVGNFTFGQKEGGETFLRSDH